MKKRGNFRGSSLCLILLIGLIFSQGLISANRIVLQSPADAQVKSLIFSFKSPDEENSRLIKIEESKFSVQNNPELISQLQAKGYVVLGQDKKVQILLEDAIQITNATRVWNLSKNNLSLNGSQVSVCVIDTGVNKNHPALAGKVIAEKCFCIAEEGVSEHCCPDGTEEDENATDNHGHGTHVAGIISASGAIQGISKGANIVAVKILNSSGFGYDSDIKKAIEWCSNSSQVSDYNISVISLSLGGGQYFSENTCISDDSVNVRSAINAAVAKNISVVIATGNTDSEVYTNPVEGICSPACLPNTTQITASPKTDNSISSYAFRHQNFPDILVAPGDDIYSTFLGSSYTTGSGTSMATPMVSGAIAILNQYFRLSGQTKTPSQIKSVLNNTGKMIYDSSTSKNYSRIDVYSSLLYSDIDSPNITIISPQNNSSLNETFRNFSCAVSDWQLKNITLRVYNSTGLFNQTSWNVSGANNFTSINLTGLRLDKIYFWNYLVYDENNNLLQTSNYTFNTNNPYIQQISPEDDFYTNQPEIQLICNASTSEETELVSVKFNVYNSTEQINQTSQTVSGTANSSVFNYTFLSEGSYFWNCAMENNLSEVYNSSNRSLTYDATYPDILGVSSVPTYNSAEISWSTSEIANASINLSDSLTNSVYSISDFLDNHQTTISGLSASTSYEFTIFYCDKANNCKTSGVYNFTTSNAPSGGGGGGGGAATTSIILNSSQLKHLQEIVLTSGKSVKLALSSKETHTLKINSIKENQVNITIYSNPLNFVLAIGEEKKISLSNPEVYELYLALRKISASKAYLIVQEINESSNLVLQQTPQEPQMSSENKENEDSKGKLVSIQNENPDKSSQNSKIIKLILAMILISMILTKVGFDVYHILKKKEKSRKTK